MFTLLNTIRDKVGTTGELKVDEMPTLLMSPEMTISGTFTNTGRIPIFMWVEVDEVYGDEVVTKKTNAKFVRQNEDVNFKFKIKLSSNDEDLHIKLMCSPGGRDILKRELDRVETHVSVGHEGQKPVKRVTTENPNVHRPMDRYRKAGA